MKNIILFLLAALWVAMPLRGEDPEPGTFIRGVYGNPGTLLDAGYAFDDLGMNAVFVRSISLTEAFYQTAKDQNCRVYVEFPVLNGKNYLKTNKEAWPINEKGEQAPPADWFMGICPTHPGFIDFRETQLREILNNFEVDGIFLDYMHWHAQFETEDPILPETCFCDRCTRQFASRYELQLQGETIPEKARWILTNAEDQWRSWRNDILNQWVDDLGAILRKKQPEALLGIFHCAWYPDDHNGALYRILGIDVKELAKRADVLSPMLFHKMINRPPLWVGEYLKWMDKLTDAGRNKEPLVWPIVQAHDKPDPVSPEEFRQVMIEGSQFPSSGIMMFSDQSLLENPEKIKVMKTLYHQELKHP